jgi:hypothetical protein
MAFTFKGQFIGILAMFQINTILADNIGFKTIFLNGIKEKRNL